MISRLHRFHGRSSLKFVYQHGKTVRGPYFALKFVLNQRRRTYRVAVVISRKVSKSAVTRNRIRRRIFAVVRELVSPADAPYDLIFTVFNDSVKDLPTEVLHREIKKQLSASGVISKS